MYPLEAANRNIFPLIIFYFSVFRVSKKIDKEEVKSGANTQTPKKEKKMGVKFNFATSHSAFHRKTLLLKIKNKKETSRIGQTPI